RRPPRSPLFPYTTLFRSRGAGAADGTNAAAASRARRRNGGGPRRGAGLRSLAGELDGALQRRGGNRGPGERPRREREPGGAPRRPDRGHRPRASRRASRETAPGGGVCVVLPLVALVGRPNVGKSTLFNRIVGRRLAIVEDVPGVTRDRQYAEAQHGKKYFRAVDTGGFTVRSGEQLINAVREQAEMAIREADVIVLVVDAVEGLAGADREL